MVGGIPDQVETSTYSDEAATFALARNPDPSLHRVSMIFDFNQPHHQKQPQLLNSIDRCICFPEQP